MRISNQGIDLPGSIQITDEYPCNDVFPNSFDAPNYLEWCKLECVRIGPSSYIHESVIKDTVNEGRYISVCHIRRSVDG